MAKSLTHVVTGKVRLSYAHVWEPEQINGQGDPKYSVSIIIPKSDTQTLNRIQDAIKEAYANGQSKLKGNGKIAPALEGLKKPLRDGDTERAGDEAYKGSMFLNATRKATAGAPRMIDRAMNPIIDREEVYSGCFARVSLDFYAFNAAGNRGIACGLGNIQKIEDGERLGGGSTPEEDFTPYGESVAADDAAAAMLS
jgi:hypothetical protein